MVTVVVDYGPCECCGSGPGGGGPVPCCDPPPPNTLYFYLSAPGTCNFASGIYQLDYSATGLAGFNTTPGWYGFFALTGANLIVQLICGESQYQLSLSCNLFLLAYSTPNGFTNSSCEPFYLELAPMEIFSVHPSAPCCPGGVGDFITGYVIE